VLAFVDAHAGATDIVVVAVASGLVVARVAFSGRGVVLYGTFWGVWNQGCNEFELVSLGVAGIDDASGTGKRAWVELEKLATLGFVAVAPALAGCSREIGGVVRRGKGRWMGKETRILHAIQKKRERRESWRGRGRSSVLLGTGGICALAGLVVTQGEARLVLSGSVEFWGRGIARKGARALTLLGMRLRSRLLRWGDIARTRCYRSWRRDGEYQRGTACAAAVCAGELARAL
jgi:hypothetical protein